MGIIAIVLIIVVYFLPTIVCYSKPNNSGAILLNIFLGWTFIGWLAALIWAAQLPKKIKTVKV